MPNMYALRLKPDIRERAGHVHQGMIREKAAPDAIRVVAGATASAFFI